MAAAEETLHGSGLEDRNLVRIADTVRRPAGPWTPSVHDVLRSLHGQGFTLAPEPLGMDGQGREVLSFLPGRDQGWPFLPEILTDRGAAALGRLATALRTALAVYDCPPDAAWQAASGAPGPGQAIQHGDLGPWNLLWDGDGEICGVLDWDLAGPGDPWYDTGHLAWFTVPFQDDVRAYERGFAEPPDRYARLEAFAAGAGTDMDDLVAIVQQTQQEFARRVLERGHTLSAGPWRKLLAMGVHEKALADQLWTRDHFGSPAAAAVPVPTGWADEQALGLVVNWPTALAALKPLGGLAAGQSVLIHAAAGGTGQAAVKMAKHYGATVIATASPGKHETVRALGADHVIDSHAGDIAAEVLRLTGGAGADLVLESVGGTTLSASLAAAKRATGRVVIYGLAGGEAAITNWDLVYKHQIHVIGLNIGILIQAAPQIFGQVMGEMFGLLSARVLGPGQPTVYELGEGPKALAELEARTTVGKLALLP